MNKYMILKERHQEEVNNFPFMSAFSDEQFNEGMKRLGLEPGRDENKICSIGGGGFIRKADSEATHEMFKRHREETQREIEADQTGSGFICDMFLYELENHEFCITGDIEDSLEALELTLEEINKSQALVKGLKAAIETINNTEY